MTMNYHHQLQLLTDILKNQQDENYGTHDEYEQVEHLISNLLENNDVPDSIKSALMNVEQFAYAHNKDGNQGNFSPDELQKWITDIQQAEMDNKHY
ncbi:YtzH-like family protein [Evansella cellulosilytica]|uniref:YtzH-like protein n=1 Tax=Evansella cellulosilytica (strain ATCC 21833 / DSM 2522 / FERM P-1141 / JCM 9156 / N-4) TaxID=649639 RepID=E6U192_EVAC2|nr:YtzH-like family protein [Evansella cellulosilytica]ADU31538.1 hypothetical protein Bcell_3296 [Evansella cellulosilytica DSM 2522]